MDKDGPTSFDTGIYFWYNGYKHICSYNDLELRSEVVKNLPGYIRGLMYASSTGLPKDSVFLFQFYISFYSKQYIGSRNHVVIGYGSAVKSFGGLTPLLTYIVLKPSDLVYLDISNMINKLETIHRNNIDIYYRDEIDKLKPSKIGLTMKKNNYSRQDLNDILLKTMKCILDTCHIEIQYTSFDEAVKDYILLMNNIVGFFRWMYRILIAPKKVDSMANILMIYGSSNKALVEEKIFEQLPLITIFNNNKLLKALEKEFLERNKIDHMNIDRLKESLKSIAEIERRYRDLEKIGRKIKRVKRTGDIVKYVEKTSKLHSKIIVYRDSTLPPDIVRRIEVVAENVYQEFRESIRKYNLKDLVDLYVRLKNSPDIDEKYLDIVLGEMKNRFRELAEQQIPPPSEWEAVYRNDDILREYIVYLLKQYSIYESFIKIKDYYTRRYIDEELNIVRTRLLRNLCEIIREQEFMKKLRKEIENMIEKYWRDLDREYEKTILDMLTEYIRLLNTCREDYRINMFETFEETIRYKNKVIKDRLREKEKKLNDILKNKDKYI